MGLIGIYPYNHYFCEINSSLIFYFYASNYNFYDDMNHDSQQDFFYFFHDMHQQNTLDRFLKYLKLPPH